MLTVFTTLAAVALAILGAWWLPDPARRLPGAGMLAAAVVLAVYSFRLVDRIWPRHEPSPQASPLRAQARRVATGSGSRWRALWVVGIVLMAAGLLLAVWALAAIWAKPFAWEAAGRWVAGMALVLVGAYLVPAGDRLRGGDLGTEVAAGASTDDRTIGPRPEGYKLAAIGQEAPFAPDDSAALETSGAGADRRRTVRWLELAAVLLILVAAVWFRSYRIQEMPPGVFIDETNSALDALRIFDGRPDSPFGTGWFETPNGFVYLQTVFFRLLGTTFTAVKLQSLLPGILTVLALWLLARELFGRAPALFAAAFLAFNRWHFNMSRWGWNELYPPLMQVLSLYFIIRAARRRSWGDWAMAGFLLGLGMFTYLSIRLAVVAIVLYLAYRAVVERGFLRRNWQGLLVFVAFYVLTFAPLAFTYYKEPFTFLNRSRQVSIVHDIEAGGGSLAPLAESAKRHLLMFHVAGDGNARHNLPGAPMLDPITGAFFLLGGGWAIWKWRDHRRGLALIWVGVTLLGGVFSQLSEAPQAYRTLAAAPAIALLCADAYDLSLRGLLAPARRWRYWLWLAGGVAAVGLLAAGWLNYNVYFNKQANSPAVYVAFSPLETTVAREVVAKRDNNRLYLSPRLYYFAPLRFFAYEPAQAIGVSLGPWRYSPFRKLGGGLEKPGFNLADPGLDLPLPDLGGDNAVFLLDQHFGYVLDLFRYFYPGTQAREVSDRMGAPLYLEVTVPGDEIQALQAHNRADEAAGIQGLYIPASGEYQMEAPAPGRILLDGEPFGTETRFLGKGLHALQIVDLPAGLPADAPVLSWQGPGDSGPAVSGPVPDSALFRKPPSGQGLLGTYYASDNWTGPELMQRVDPLLLTSWPDPEPVFGAFSATWTGELLAPAEGLYAFQLNADDGVRLTVAGQMLGESLNPDTVNMVAAATNLTAGPHPVRIDYFQRGGGKALEFFWQPPGQAMQPVAPQYLRPAGE